MVYKTGKAYVHNLLRFWSRQMRDLLLQIRRRIVFRQMIKIKNKSVK